MDNAVRALFSVSKGELLKAEARLSRARGKKKRSKKS
jgi:hypothetical protein